MTDNPQLPLGFYVKVAFKGPKCIVGHLGEMSGLAVVERDSEEPLQYIPSGVSVISIMERWESMFGAWEKARNDNR